MVAEVGPLGSTKVAMGARRVYLGLLCLYIVTLPDIMIYTPSRCCDQIMILVGKGTHWVGSVVDNMFKGESYL